ncbi:hypothetical protein BDZ97DRAFT_1920745 [Flammula alnicola]|nr:hypothetical protein BDZ97DRAFT_1920745 [Flammula alnicola]
MFRTLANCALLALQALSGIASPVMTGAAEELVSTPYGFVPKSNVHLVPKGGRVHHTATGVQLIGADGTILHSAPLTSSKPGPSSTHFNISGTLPTIAKRNLNSGYVAYAYWENVNPSPIIHFTTSWTVPPTPANWDGQILYYANALLPSSFDAILHPTLQFGETNAGGGAYWGIASWYTVGSNVYHTALTAVQPGQALTGYMDWESSSTSGSTTTNFWRSLFLNYAGNSIPESYLYISTTEVLNWAYEALSIFNTLNAGDLPTGNTMMTDINLYTQDFQNPVLTWGTVSDPSDGIFMSVISTSSTNGAVQISYPNQ